MKTFEETLETSPSLSDLMDAMEERLGTEIGVNFLKSFAEVWFDAGIREEKLRNIVDDGPPGLTLDDLADDAYDRNRDSR